MSKSPAGASQLDESLRREIAQESRAALASVFSSLAQGLLERPAPLSRRATVVEPMQQEQSQTTPSRTARTVFTSQRPQPARMARSERVQLPSSRAQFATLPNASDSGSNIQGITFDQFILDSVNHRAIVANRTNSNGVYSITLTYTKVNADQSSNSNSDSSSSAVAALASRQPVLEQLSSGNAYVNGQPTNPSPLAGGNDADGTAFAGAPFSCLTCYGQTRLPAGVIGGSDPTQGRQVYAFAQNDPTGATLLTNKMSDPHATPVVFADEGQLKDANTQPINQPIVALAASPTSAMFFPVVADGSLFTGTIPQPNWGSTPDAMVVRNAFIAGMQAITDSTGTTAPQSPTDEVKNAYNALEPAAVVPAVPDDKEKFIQKLSTAVLDVFYRSGYGPTADGTTQGIANVAHAEFVNQLGGNDHSWLGAAGTLAGVADPLKTVFGVFDQKSDRLVGMIGKVGDQPDADQFKLVHDTAQDFAAMAVQAMAGQALNALIAQSAYNANAGGDATPPALVLPGTRKTFASIDGHSLISASAAANASASSGDGLVANSSSSPGTPQDWNVNVFDVEGLGRGVAYLEVEGAEKPAFLHTASVKTGQLAIKPLVQGTDTSALPAVSCASFSSADYNAASRALINGVVSNAAAANNASSSSSGSSSTTQSGPALIDNGVELLWDDHLQRLFVGLHDVSLGNGVGTNSNVSGGACAVMMGQKKTDSIFLEPIIKNMHPILFQRNLTPDEADATKVIIANPDTDYIVGFYHTYNPNINTSQLEQALHASAKHLNVMHTSTGKDYLIFNGGVATRANFATLGSKVYALPLVGQSYSADAKVAALTGYVAQRTGLPVTGIDFTKPVGQWGAYDKDVQENLDSLLKSEVSNVQAAVQHVADNAPKSPEKEAAGTLVADKGFVPGLASACLQAIYDKVAQADAITQVVTAIQGDYSKYPFPRPSGVLTLVEKDLLVANAQLQAPADLMSEKYVKPNVGIFANAANAAYDKGLDAHVQNVFGAVNVQQSFEGNNLKSNSKAGAFTNVIQSRAGALLALEAGLGIGVNRPYNNAAGADDANLKRENLIAAIKTMHVDLPDLGFGYVRVGRDPQILSYNTSALINDVQVVGDTVYVALGGQRDANHNTEQGIFASTALFADDGHIRDWTPWQRVGGAVAPVGALGLDESQGRFWYGTDQSGNALQTPLAMDDFAVSQWGLGTVPTQPANATGPFPDQRLTTVVDAIFGDVGGVVGLFDFGPRTQGFKEFDLNNFSTPALRHPQFSMLVATGDSRVALIQTGTFDVSGTGVFQPTTDFIYQASADSGDAQNVFVFDVASDNFVGEALGQVGVITCAELSRLPLGLSGQKISRDGWLFVGGTGGAAVLTRWFTGKGWATDVGSGLAGLLGDEARDNFPGGQGWRFLQLLVKTEAGALENRFQNVRKIISDQNRWLYILTATELWRIDMSIAGVLKDGDRDLTTYSNFRRSRTNVRPSAQYECLLPASACQLVASIQESTSDGDAAHVFGDADQFLDMQVLFRANAAPSSTQLLIGATNGLWTNTAADLPDAEPNVSALRWTAIAPTGGTLGSVLRIDVATRAAGGRLNQASADAAKTVGESRYFLDANLLVTAMDDTKKYLAAYRFDVSGGADPVNVELKPFSEPYAQDFDKARPTPYFYKLGDINGQVIPQGPLDFYPHTSDISGSGSSFAQAVPMLPKSDAFLADDIFQVAGDINLGYQLSQPLTLGNVVRDSATGALLVPGEFGLRINN